MRLLFLALILLLSNETIAQAIGKDDIELKEVVVNGKKIKYKVGTIGKSNVKHDGGYYMRNSEEVAIFLQEEGIPAKSFLNEVFIFITDEGKPTANFMVHVYAKDDTSNWPGKELTKKIAHAEKGDEWVKVDFSDRRILVKDILIVSVEWLEGNGNDDTPWQREDKRHPLWSTSSYINHNGQVLGSTNDYGMTDLTFTTKAGNLKEWCYSMNPGRKVRRGGMRFSHQWNPMIYCTYTYSK
jgi:hypothetical protein